MGARSVGRFPVVGGSLWPGAGVGKPSTARGINLDKLLEERGTAAIAAHDREIRFRSLAGGADRNRALAVLERLDALDRAATS